LSRMKGVPFSCARTNANGRTPFMVT
jgi:hypothetical protein